MVPAASSCKDWLEDRIFFTISDGARWQELGQTKKRRLKLTWHLILWSVTIPYLPMLEDPETDPAEHPGRNQPNPGFDYFFFFLIIFCFFFDFFLICFWFVFDSSIWMFFFWFLIKSLFSAFWEEFPFINLITRKHLQRENDLPLPNPQCSGAAVGGRHPK